MKRIKQITGIILIVAAIAGLCFWEIKGRNIVLTENVIVASADILPGTVITKENICIKGVLSDDMIVGAVLPQEYESMIGRTVSSYIPRNSQITNRMLVDPDYLVLDAKQSVFELKSEWIDMKSSSLRRGDRVTIFGNKSLLPVGTFRVAFVKDSSGREVRNAAELYTDTPLNRDEATAPIECVEIICTLDDYNRIKKTVQNEKSDEKGAERVGALLLVQEVKRSE